MNDESMSLETMRSTISQMMSEDDAQKMLSRLASRALSAGNPAFAMLLDVLGDEPIEVAASRHARMYEMSDMLGGSFDDGTWASVTAHIADVAADLLYAMSEDYDPSEPGDASIVVAVDGETPCTLAELIDANREGTIDWNAIRALAVGQEWIDGGGAAAECRIVMVSK